MFALGVSSCRSGLPFNRTFTSASHALPALASRCKSVLELVREGIPAAEICRDYYPDLTTDDIRACVQYAIDLIALENIRLAETV